MLLLFVLLPLAADVAGYQYQSSSSSSGGGTSSNTPATIDCVECASVELLNNWDITGLPHSLSEKNFSPLCSSGGYSGQLVSCAGYCMTYIFDHPDNLTQKMYVRGCHPKIAQVTAQISSLNINQKSFCEYDPMYVRINAMGQYVDTQMLVEFCTANSGDSPCNSHRLGYPQQGVPDSQCIGQNYNATLANNQPLQCYQCDAPNANCLTGVCSKKYCMRSVTSVQNTYTTRKFCSDVNVFGVDEYCSTREITIASSASNRFSAKNTQCFCKDREYCNGVVRVGGASLLTGLMVVVIGVIAALGWMD